MPAPVGLAATFSTEAARLYGVVLGREAKALEQDILLAPYINIVRDPLFRRNHTTLGEDPFLNAQSPPPRSPASRARASWHR